MHARVQLAISTLFSLGSPTQGIVLLTVNMGLPTSIYYNPDSPPKSCQMTLDSVKLTINTVMVS